MGAAEALGGSTHNRLIDPLDIFIELVVPDAQDGPTFLVEKRVAPFVGRGFRMLAAV